MSYRLRLPQTLLYVGLIFGLVRAISADPGGLDANHVDRATGQYHCHRAGRVLPTGSSNAPVPHAISVASFNIQLLGNSPDRDNEAPELPRELTVVDLVKAMETSWPLRHMGPYPGAPSYDHNESSAVYSDHDPIEFQIDVGGTNDD